MTSFEKTRFMKDLSNLLLSKIHDINKTFLTNKVVGTLTFILDSRHIRVDINEASVATKVIKKPDLTYFRRIHKSSIEVSNPQLNNCYDNVVEK